MILMKLRAVLLESLYWAALVALIVGWLFLAPIWWEILSFVASMPWGGEFLFSAAGLLLLAKWWMSRHARRARMEGYAPGDLRTTQGVRHAARHEAAHAVVAWALGSKVTRISTEFDGTSGGHCSLAPQLERPLVDEKWLLLRVCMASTVIEHQDRQQERGGCSTDLAQALAHAATIIATGSRPAGYTGPLTLEALIAGATQAAHDLLAHHTHLVEAVADRVGHVRVWIEPDLTALERETSSTELVTS